MNKEPLPPKLQKLFDMKQELGNIKTGFKEGDSSKSRLGALVITKLEEVKHWLNDLISESIQEEENKEKNLSNL